MDRRLNAFSFFFKTGSLWNKSIKIALSAMREGYSCASDGNRTRTGIAAHGIFLLLLLLHKPASS